MKSLIAMGLLWILLGSGPIWAARPPQDVVQDTSARMLSALRQNRATLDRDPGRLYELVNQIVCPTLSSS